MTEPWIESWPTQSDPDTDHYVIVQDPDVGTLAELTTPSGERFYGFDPATRPDYREALRP